MDNALAIYGQFENMQRAAVALWKSNYFGDAKSEAQAIVKVMAGAELGLPPFAAMTGIHIIQGKPALGANVIATLIKNDPRYNYRVLEMTDSVCRIQFFENGEPCGVSEFSATDARKAGTKNMDKYPRNMLFARAISNGAKWYTPGIFGGAPVYTPDELGADVDEDGNIIEGSYSYTAVAEQPQPRQQQPQADAGGKYTDRFLQYCVDNIDRYDNVFAVRNALKKQYPEETSDRQEQMRRFEWLRDYAAMHDGEEAGELPGLFDDDETPNGAYAE